MVAIETEGLLGEQELIPVIAIRHEYRHQRTQRSRRHAKAHEDLIVIPGSGDAQQRRLVAQIAGQFIEIVVVITDIF